MFWVMDNFYGGFDPFDGPNRSGWAEKSEAAISRENHAKRLFESFYSKCANMDASIIAFPQTEEIIGPETHLTSACYTSFRKYVTNKGCKVKRREITLEEKLRLPKSSARKSKQYAISVTVPVHPGKLAEKKVQDEKAAKERAEKANAAAAKKALLEKEIKEKSTKEFAALKDGTHHLVMLGKRSDVEESSVDKENTAPAAKKPKGGKKAPPAFSVPRTAILERLNEDQIKRKLAVQGEITKERRELLDDLDKKKAKMQKDIDQDCERLRTLIVKASQTN